jgi:hypothetical protein
LFIGSGDEGADSVISQTQTTFMPGRNILEDVVILHETLHELRRKKKKAIIMNFEKKVYDRVQMAFSVESEILVRKKISYQMDTTSGVWGGGGNKL